MRPPQLLLGLVLAAALAATAPASEPVQVTNDGYLNYMPSLLQRDGGGLLIVYERLDANFENGDLMAVTSDGGASWSAPSVVVAGPGNQRHPSVVQKADGSYLVHYLSDETGSYKIHSAASADGALWTVLGVVDLGWTTEQLVNPTVCAEPDGSFTMAYDRLSAGGYVAHSADGLAWDHDRTPVSTGSLNRILRHSGGTYLLSYQRRTGLYYYQIDIFTRTSIDRVNWSSEVRVTTNQNSHDSFPIELADGSCGLYYAKSTGGQPYDLMRRSSPDGSAWSAEEAIVPYAGWDTQPHPILTGGAAIAMAWPRGAAQNTTQVHFVLLDDASGLEGESALAGARPIAWPNPFREGVEIRLGEAPGGAPRLTPGGRSATIRVHDVSGREVAVIPLAGPDGRLVWNGVGSAGRRVLPGVYFARAEGRDTAVRIVKLP